MRQITIVLPLISFLTACGGGGGSSGTPTIQFTSMSAISNPSTVQFQGITVENSFTIDANTEAVTAVGTAQNGTATVTKSYDSSGNQTSISIYASQSSTSTNASTGSSNGTSPTSSYQAFANSNADNFTLMSGRILYEYQTLGVWETGRNTTQIKTGAVSAGAPTAGTSIPTSGTATFTGDAVGITTDTGGNRYMTAATANLSADFGSRNLTMNTTNTTKVNLNTANVATDPSLNLSGTMSYAPGSNSFTGNVSTQGGMTGTSTGRFYGPSANEAGGTFNTKGVGTQTYIGAFGAKR